MTTINDRWKEFAAAVVPRDAGPTQRRECKRMFFAGAASMMDIMLSDVATLEDDDAAAAIDSLRKQLLGFNEAVKMGAE